MILALLSAALLSQTCNTPSGIAVFSEPLCPSATTYQYRVLANTSAKCLAFARDGLWHCLAEADAPSNGLRSLSSAPSTPIAGETYYDTTKGCLQSWDGSAWAPSVCPSTTPAVTVGSSAPSLPSGDASLNRGRFWLDTTAGCTRQTPDGLAWGDCLTVERCVSVSVSGVSIPLLGVSSTSTASLAGAVVGRPCVTGVPGFLPLNASAVCRVSAAGTVEYRFQSNSGLLSGIIAIPNGTYTLCTSVNW